uniref:Peptidase S1 domain-containing protein n=1 Tax=Ditylenchus dipsaci TaxID=166011 RepID=A0A915DNP1_9BILA
MIDLSLYLDDFCGYLGLCTPSSDGLYKLLSLDSLPVAANYFTYDCKERGNASLIDDNQQVVCENVMWVSSQHLVTTRDCLSDLKPWLSGVGVLRVLTTTNTDYLVEFVAWSSTHSIAIVQLIEDTEEIVCLPSSTTLKPFLGSFCIYLNLCSNQQHLIHNSLGYFNHFFYSSTQSVGPKNWLIKLNETEQANYMEQCVSHSSSVQNRIVGGKVAKQGQFPFAAVLIYKYVYDTRCGGSIISPWHILTARHCIDGDQESFDILIGGVCYNRDNRDCAQVDMITSLPPFELISEEDRHKILDDCKLMQQQNQESNACALNLPWNAVLVDENGRSLCSLTFVTYKHVITTRDCVLANLETPYLYVLSKKAQLFEIDFIAWSYAHPIVIIQLKENQNVTPVCFKGKPTNLFRSPQIVAHNITDLDKYPDKKETDLKKIAQYGLGSWGRSTGKSTKVTGWENLLKLAFVDGSLVNPFSEDNYGFFWGKGFSNQETGPWEPSSVRDRCIELYTPFTSTPRHFGGKMSSSCCAALLLSANSCAEPLPLPESSPLPISMQSALPFSESSSLQTPKSSPVPTFVLSSLLTPEPSSLPTPESTSLPTPLPSPLPTLESSPLPTPESSSLQTPESSPLRTPAPSPRPTLEPSSLPAPESSSLAPTTIPAYLPTDSVLTCPPCTCPTLPSYLETSTCSQQTITGALVTVTYKESTFHLTPVQHGDLLYSDSEGSKLLVNGKDLNLWMTLEKDRDNKVSIINDVAQVWEQDSPQTHVYRRSFFDAADNSKKTHSQFKFLEELIEMLKKDACLRLFNGCLGNACVQTSIDFNNQSYTLSVQNITELYELQTKLGQLLEVCLEIKLAVDDKRYTSYIPSHQTVDGLWKIIKSVTEKDRWIFGDTTQDPTLAGYLMFNETTVLLESYALWMLDEYELEFCSKEKLWKGIAEVEQVIGCSGEVCNQAMFRLTTEPTNAENIIELVFRAENDINQTMDILYEMMEDVFDFVIKDDFGEQKQWLVAEVNMEESLQVRYRNEWLNRKDILILVDKQPN